jgi:hypothetical protein
MLSSIEALIFVITVKKPEVKKYRIIYLEHKRLLAPRFLFLHKLSCMGLIFLYTSLLGFMFHAEGCNL